MVTSPDAPNAAVFAPRGLQRLGPRAVVLALIIWWWPSLTGAGDTVDVLLSGDAEIVADSNPVLRRLREAGLEVAVHPEWSDWCDAYAGLAPVLESTDPEVVVLSFRHEGTCDRGAGPPFGYLAEQVAAEKIPLVVLQPGQGPPTEGFGPALAALDDYDHVTIADASRLLGDGPTAERAPCQWWDDCDPDGMVAVRDAGGALTPAGLERLARVLVSVIP